MKAQEYLEKNWTNKNITKIQTREPQLTGNLAIQDYPNLEEIDLKNHQLTSLTIINCPSLKKINLRNNQLTKLEIDANNQIQQIIASKNELTSLDLINCPKLKELIICDNPFLVQQKGLNLSEIKQINLLNTPINLAQDYEQIKEEKEDLIRILKNVKEGAEEKELVLTEAIQTSLQADEAIQRHLKKIEREWRDYFVNPNPKSLLDLSFQDFQLKRRAKKILTWIIETQESRNYSELIKKWNSGEEYNADYDFDGSLDKLMQLLKVHAYLKKEESLPTTIQN